MAKTEDIVTVVASLPDGTRIIEHADGRLERTKSKTDWARLDKLTDKEIAKAVAKDPDAAPLDIDWSEVVFVTPTRKKAISIRLDEDVIEYFKKEGEGYQSRMNAVLRTYVQHKKPKKRA